MIFRWKFCKWKSFHVNNAFIAGNKINLKNETSFPKQIITFHLQNRAVYWKKSFILWFFGNEIFIAKLLPEGALKWSRKERRLSFKRPHTTKPKIASQMRKSENCLKSEWLWLMIQNRLSPDKINWYCYWCVSAFVYCFIVLWCDATAFLSWKQ